MIRNHFGLLMVCFALAAPLVASEIVTLPLPEGVSEAVQPQVAVVSPQDVYVVFGSGKTIYTAASHDGGSHFETPMKVGLVPSLMLGKRRGPRIAGGSEGLVIAAIGQGGELLSFRSIDRGQTWSGPITINDVPKSAREGLHALASGPKGEIFCAWLDLRNESPEVFGSASTDGGKTWSQNRLIYRSPQGNVCECCHPSVTFDADGNLYVMWRNWLGGNRDMYYSVSKDHGQSFSTAERLGLGHWRLDHCPMDGGAIAVRKPGDVATAWRREKTIFATLPGHQEETRLGEGEQPWITANQQGPWITWVSKENGDLLLWRPTQRTSEVLAHHADDPVIASPQTGVGPVVLAWESRQEKTPRLSLLVLPVTPAE